MSTHLSRLQRLHAPTATHAELLEVGRAERGDVPRSAHAEYRTGDRDPLVILAEQNATRVPSLVPLRMGRMLANPFTFYRGTAAIMAADLARNASTDIPVVACGDAHISNFGFFASPQRSLVFDLNDFDEAAPAPWEWDLKRLLTSVVVSGQHSRFAEADIRSAALGAARVYRESINALMSSDALRRYYSLADIETIRAQVGKEGRKILTKAARQAERRTSAAYVEKITSRAADGTRVLIENPPVLTHVPEASETDIEALFEQYRESVPKDVAHLLSQFTLTDLAMRVVGVGSVGTRCFILMLTGPNRESLVLQIKEAPMSVLQRYGGIAPDAVPSADWTVGAGLIGGGEIDALTHVPNEGRRVVGNQRILQAVSDPFLGFLRSTGKLGATDDATHHDFYVRQFRDKKGSIDPETLNPAAFTTYVEGCAILLARAHAQSANASAVAGYLGRSDRFDRAVVEWSFGYAAQSLRDFERLRDAAESGEVEVVVEGR
ncbi:DUF2252 domain-containing protein [Plantibacter sp. YIM 135249]|uniref:DUF2252 domain-containing protein n=1 Tax=Plantibacter sp. YIM 135249 TaxID=3423918 RepID=UPI003D32D98D